MATQTTWLVPGPWSDLASFARAMKPQGQLVEQHGLRLPRGHAELVFPGPDARRSFAHPMRPLAPATVSAIRDATGFVALILPLSIERDAASLVELGRALERAGAPAVRIEDSGQVHTWAPWLDALERRDLTALHDLAVMLVADGHVLYTCGMHLFDRPDAECPRDAPDEDIASTLRTLGLYQLHESPAFAPGHTFTPYQGPARRELVRWPDTRHDSAGAYHNPFGVWRLSSPGARTRTATELALTPIPPLLTLLVAMEKKAQRPLVRDEVLKVRESMVCMAMKHADARALEIARGYADLDPELAWEQWQLVRRRFANRDGA
jgi:hypothetical protein